jgi:branched-chain amino acid aminotransferase
MSDLKVWINDKFVDTKYATVSVFDRGFLFGDGLFETMRSYGGRVFRMRDHMDRLFRSFRVMRMKLPYSVQYLEDTVYATLAINKLKDAYIRLTVTRGAGKFGLAVKEEFNPNVVIAAREFTESPEHVYSRGISAGIVNIRQNELSPVCGVKSLNFLNYILARFEAKDGGFEDAIIKNTKGYIAEGATSNVFIVTGKELITPSVESGILPGITRKVVIEVARQSRIRVREEFISERELLDADEVFLTNSLVELMPVVRIGGRRIGRGHPGHVTASLRSAYKKQVVKETRG